MNLQENIRRILREIEEDKIQIRLGRSAERHFGKVQNIIIMVDDQDITSEDDVPGLGKMNIVIKDNEIIVGDIFIPEKYRKQGIATIVYQKISDYFNLPIVNSKTKGFNQTIEGGHIWKKRERFEPKNLQEQIRKVLKEETNPANMVFRRVTPNELEQEFNESLIFAVRIFNKRDTMSLAEFRNYTISNTIDGIHWLIESTTPEDTQWYDNVFYFLKSFFGDRIEEKYNELIGNE